MRAERFYGDAPVKHTCSLTVRSYECDSYAHVNNAVYLHYLETARHEYMKSLGFGLDALREAGYSIWVAKIAIRYLIPARTDDLLSITTEPVKKGRLSGVLSQRIRRGDLTIAEADITWASVDAKGKPAPLPAAFDLAGLAP